MRNQFPAAALALGVLAACAGMAQAQTNTEDGVNLVQATEEFRIIAENYRKAHDIPSMSYAIVRDGKIIASEGIGWQDHDAEEPTTTDTTYLVASITKTFTGATLLAMEDEGVIGLDEEFTTLSDWDERCEWLSGSGIIFAGGTATEDGYVPPEIDCNAALTLENVLQMRVLGEPGSNFLYNPVVFGRLSNWVEEKTGKPFAWWVRRHVIDKAGLKDVAAGWRDRDGGDALLHLAPPFRILPNGEGARPGVLPNPEMNGSSGIIASAESLARYSIALDEGRILAPDLRDRMWSPPVESNGQSASYAYGWWTQEWNGQRIVWHGGWWPDAYSGLLLKLPDSGLTFVMLGNSEGLHVQMPLHEARIESHPLVAQFLAIFATPESAG